MTSTVESGSLPIIDCDPFSEVILEEPGDFHAALRDAGPVVYLPRCQVFSMGRYEQVHSVLRDWQGFESGAGVGMRDYRREERPRSPGVLETDPPLHDAPRVVLEKILGPRALRRLRAAWFADAEKLVDHVLQQEEFDAIPALAEAFPLRVFPDAVGIPDEGREHLLPHADHLFNTMGPANDLVARGLPRATERSGWVEAQCAREAMSEDGFGAQIWSAADRGDITVQKAPSLVRVLLSVGVDTTVNGLAAVLYAVATNPEQWRALRQEPYLVRTAFDEAVRWQSPIQTFFRTATSDIHIGETIVPEGQKVLLSLGSANRDPRRWAEPDRFDLARDPSGHVGFGMGIHQCVGQHVARLESEALLTALVRRVQTIELVAPPIRQCNNILRMWRTLPVAVRPV